MLEPPNELKRRCSSQLSLARETECLAHEASHKLSEAVSRSADLAQLQASFAASTPVSSSSQPITVNVQVDGETIARAAHNAQRDSAGRAFSSVPAY